MIKETITYTDFNGNERTETFWFNLTKAEVARMELSVNGGMAEMMQRIVDAKDAPSLIKVFEEVIQRSYGVKTPDGRGFVKRKEDLEDFMSTEAYSQLYMELITDANAAAEFINGIFPSDFADKTMRKALPND